MIDSQDRRTLPSAIERLSAPGPFAADKDELMLYGRLIGAWDVDWVAFDESGDTVERRRCEWHFAWVLGGRGVFMSPGDGEFVALEGRHEGDRIVQEVIDRPSDTPAERWTFSEITDAG